MKGILELLVDQPLFSEITPQQMKIVAQHCHIKIFHKDEIIFNESDPGNALYYIMEGTVKILKTVENEHKIAVAKVEKGCFVGEMALLDHTERSATVQAMEETLTLMIEYSHFEEILKSNSEIAFLLMKAIARILSNQLRLTTAKLATTQIVID